jgi:guanylate cyclase
MKLTPRNLAARMASIGARDSDDEELKLQKSLLVICAIPFIIAGVIWAVMYMQFGEVSAGWIPMSYSIFSLASLIYFGLTGKFRVFRFSQLLLILLLPFLLMLSLGGFINGSAVILWSLICPLGAMLFDKLTNAYRWLIAFGILVLVSVILQPWLREENRLSATQIELFFVINLVTVGSLIFLMVYYFVIRKNFFQQRSEALLLNILPRQIADELRTKGRAEARQYSEVTVMFTDFRNFTKIAEKLSPAELVAEIDAIFRSFDNIIAIHGLEKIKTIGDAYMCAGGLPEPTTTHARDVVRAGLAIRDFMEQHISERKRNGKDPYEIRIGIHSGPVVAGIVGRSKFAYDIWGDAVNLASRMESSGEPGKVNISGTTYELVKGQFQCVPRGRIQAKNKGEVDMYFVEGERI